MTRDEARGHSREIKRAARKLLERILKRLANPARWCKGAFARRADGSVCSARDEDAVQWCLFGAAICETHGADVRARALAMCWLNEAGVMVSHQVRNDLAETTHEGLVAWLRRSIKRARESEDMAG